MIAELKLFFYDQGISDRYGEGVKNGFSQRAQADRSISEYDVY
jgi:hypothetical protein